MTTAPNREDWEDKLIICVKDLLFAFQLKESREKTEVLSYDFGNQVESIQNANVVLNCRYEALRELVRDIIKNHNNALVAEIEKMKLVGTEYVGHLNSEGFNRALDTIIRIIQEK